MILDKSSSPNRVVLLELTVPFGSANAFEAARLIKVDRYERIAQDIEEKGFNVLNCPLEIGCRGVISARNRGVLATIASLGKIKKNQGRQESHQDCWEDRSAGIPPYLASKEVTNVRRWQLHLTMNILM